VNIDPHLLEDIENPDHPSDFVPGDGYTVLVLRLPEVTKEGISAVSYAFVVEGESCFCYDREEKELEKIGDLTDLDSFLDTKTEKFIKNPAANALLKREYRAPFIVPEQV
jgi:magnesium transporter